MEETRHHHMGLMSHNHMEGTGGEKKRVVFNEDKLPELINGLGTKLSLVEVFDKTPAEARFSGAKQVPGMRQRLVGGLELTPVLSGEWIV